MKRRILLAAAFTMATLLGYFGYPIGRALASTCSVPYSFSNGTIADATQVNANFNALVTCFANLNAVTSITAGSDIVVSGGATTPTIAVTAAPSFSGAISVGKNAAIGGTQTAGTDALDLKNSSNALAFAVLDAGGFETNSGVSSTLTHAAPTYTITGGAVPASEHSIQGNGTCTGSGSIALCFTVNLSGGMGFTSNQSYACWSSYANNTYSSGQPGSLTVLVSGSQFQVYADAISSSTVYVSYGCQGS